MLLISVLFPAPFGPSSPRHSPARTLRLTLSTAVKSPNRFTSASTSSAGPVPIFCALAVIVPLCSDSAASCSLGSLFTATV